MSIVLRLHQYLCCNAEASDEDLDELERATDQFCEPENLQKDNSDETNGETDKKAAIMGEETADVICTFCSSQVFVLMHILFNVFSEVGGVRCRGQCCRYYRSLLPNFYREPLSSRIWIHKNSISHLALFTIL